jgi:hypothetical protein
LAVQMCREVDSGRNLIIHEDAFTPEYLGQSIVQPTSVGGRVFSAVIDKDRIGHNAPENAFQSYTRTWTVMTAGILGQAKWASGVSLYGSNHVRSGSEADRGARPFDVRFTPNSGHRLSALGCSKVLFGELAKLIGHGPG